MKNKDIILTVKVANQTKAGIAAVKNEVAELSKIASSASAGPARGPARRARADSSIGRDTSDARAEIIKAAQAQDRADAKALADRRQLIAAIAQSRDARKQETEAARQTLSVDREDIAVRARAAALAARAAAAPPPAPVRPRADAAYRDYDLRAELQQAAQQQAARRAALAQETAARVRAALQAASAERFGLNALRERLGTIREEIALRMKAASTGAKGAGGGMMNNIRSSLSKMGGAIGAAGGGGGGGGGGPGGLLGFFSGRSGAQLPRTIAAVTGAFSGLRGAMGALGAFFTVGGAVGLIDEYKQLEARVRLVTNSEREHGLVMDALGESAGKTRVRLKDTADVYYSLARNNMALGLTQRELIGLTETINKTVAISGTSAQAASFGLIQLGQAFGTGQLRGEELNSVLEQLPALATTIVAGLKKVAPELAKTITTPGALKTLAEDGKLSVELILKAIQSMVGEVDSAFEKMPVTVGQGLTVLRSGMQQFLVNFDKASGATNGLATVFLRLGQILGSPEFAAAAANIGNAIGAGLNFMIDAIVSAIAFISKYRSEIQTLGEVLLAVFAAKMVMSGITSMVAGLATLAPHIRTAVSAMQLLVYGIRQGQGAMALFNVIAALNPIGALVLVVMALVAALGYLGIQYVKNQRDIATMNKGMAETQRVAQLSKKEFEALGPAALRSSKAQIDAAIKLKNERAAQLKQEIANQDTFYGRLKDLAAVAFEGIAAIGGAVWGYITTKVSEFVSYVGGFLSSLYNDYVQPTFDVIAKVGITAFNVISTAIAEFYTVAYTVATNFKDVFVGAFQTIINLATEFGSAIYTAMTTGSFAGFDGLLARSLDGQLLNGMSNINAAINNAGKNVGNAFNMGVKGEIGGTLVLYATETANIVSKAMSDALASRKTNRAEAFNRAASESAVMQFQSNALGARLKDTGDLDAPQPGAPPPAKKEDGKDKDKSKNDAALKEARRFYDAMKQIVSEGKSVLEAYTPSIGVSVKLADDITSINNAAAVTTKQLQQYERELTNLANSDPQHAQEYKDAIADAKMVTKLVAENQQRLLAAANFTAQQADPAIKFQSDAAESLARMGELTAEQQERFNTARDAAIAKVTDMGRFITDATGKAMLDPALVAYWQGEFLKSVTQTGNATIIDGIKKSLAGAKVEAEGQLATRGYVGKELAYQQSVQEKINQLVLANTNLTRQEALESLRMSGVLGQIRTNLELINEAKRQTPADAAMSQIDAFAEGFITLQDIGTQMANTVGSALGNISNAFTELAMTGKLSFKSLARSIIADLMAILVKALIVRTILSFIPGLGTALGISGAASNVASNAIPGALGGNFVPQMNAAGFVANVAHAGGLAGQATPMSRAVTADAFASAQRYHKGGLAGLRKGEVPIIAEAGEAILPTVRLPNGKMGVQSTGGGGGQAVFAPSVTINMNGAAGGGGDPAAQQEQAKMISQMVERSLEAKMMEFTQRQSRPGGAFRGNFSV